MSAPQHAHHLFCLALLTLCGCGTGSLSHTIDADKLSEASRQGQIVAFDAENAVVVALNQLDAAREALSELSVQKRRAERRLRRARKKGGEREQVARAYERYIEARIELQQTNIIGRKLGVLSARANAELAKALVLAREGLLGSRAELRKFRDQAREWSRRLRRHRKIVSKGQARVEKHERRYWKARARYVSASGDHNNEMWLD
ncbi:MAG: hypothetical protein H6707_13865 [Deltaproteobacteria bacterium]|nr:hypothetical protein [Deltaproteobacteria bacterium]